MRQTALSILLAMTCLGFSASVSAESNTKPAAATDLTNRAALLSFTCAGCHGMDGASVGPASPTIAGLAPDTFTEAMQQFKKGERPATIMGRIAKGYTDEEIELMAEYFSKQTFVPAKQEVNAEIANKGKELHENYCAKCHEAGGAKDVDGSSILAGQWKPYLTMTLADFYSKEREAGKKMGAKLEDLQKDHGDDGVKALIEYYSSQQ